jgi:hypothetical protein
MGQEDAIRDLVAVYRQLPAVRFQLSGEPGGSGQPVTLRYATRDGRTYAYLINDVPFPVTARVRIEAPPAVRIESLGSSRPVGRVEHDTDGDYWDVELGPYDLMAASFSAPGVRLARPQVSWPRDVQTSLEKLIGDLGDRVAALRNPPVWEALQNPGFERPPVTPGSIPGWICSAPRGATIEPDTAVKHEGEGARSVRLTSSGPVASLVSQPFKPPTTGRLSMSVWLRVADAARQPALRLALEGNCRGRDFYRCAQLGRATGSGPVNTIGTDWAVFLFQVNDLPLEGLSRLQVRFDLAGPGEVWLDDVELCDLDFSKKERAELVRLIAPADMKLQNGEIGDCLRLLEGYWPRFLVENVSLGETALTQPGEPRPPAAAKPVVEQAARSPGFFERMRSVLPDRLRF